jgi:hypothetical protein
MSGIQRRQRPLTVFSRRHYPFAELDLIVPGVQPRDAFEHLRRLEEHEALYVTRAPSDIYPVGGWVITHPIYLDRRSIRGYVATWLGRPGIRRYIGMRIADRRPRIFDRVLSFRMSGEKIYYHVLNDLIGGRLRLAEAHDVPEDTPIVISEGLAAAPFFQDLQKLPALRDRAWVVQNGRELIRSREIVFAETCGYNIDNFDYALRLIGVDGGDPSSSERLFVMRDQSAGRVIANSDDIESICRRFGFRMIDPARMRFWEQVETFARASHVVAVHGAGLTNLIFRKNAPLQLLEITPGQLPLPYYFYICRKYGFDYRMMVGDSSESYPWRSPFRIDADRLGAHVEDMLESSRA